MRELLFFPGEDKLIGGSRGHQTGFVDRKVLWDLADHDSIKAISIEILHWGVLCF
jgi:hypothetical protein